MSNLEKINIFVPESIDNTLKSDMRLFEIFKNDHMTPNKNRFLSLLIAGYYNLYMEDLRKQYQEILNIIKPIISDEHPASEISEKVLNIIFKSSQNNKLEKKNVRLSLKPTMLTENILLQIINSTEIGGYVSPFLCRLFTDYCSKPLDEREKIIFSDSYAFLAAACENHQSVSFSTVWNPNVLHTVYPYKIITGQGEMFNYLLCQERDAETSTPYARTYRLNRISKSTYAKPDSLEHTIQNRLDRMAQYGAQYIINDEDETCVFLTDNGVRLYNRIYYGRPLFTKIEEVHNGYNYYFQCSKDQLLFYFRRFTNGDAIILAPERLRIDMISFHENALEAYK